MVGKEMLFTDVHLQNFRSYVDASFELGSRVTIVVGPNAAGKTNLLEAVMMAAAGKTYRPNENLIKQGAEWARIEVHTNKNNQRVVKINHTGQTAEIDKKPYKSMPFSQKYPVVLFEPYDLLLLHGEPQNRRDYLDNLLDQLEAEHSKNRREYKRALAQRNKLLKQKMNEGNVLFALNVKLSQTAAKIVYNRRQLIDKLSEKINAAYQEIAPGNTEVSVHYKSSVPSSNYSANLIKKLEENTQKDFERGFTSVGPHRDDIEFLFGDELAGSIGSRGEARTLLLSLKILELKTLEERLGKKPLLLLDDVFSELDGARRKSLVRFLNNYQSIITTTDADIISKNFSQNCQIIPLG